MSFWSAVQVQTHRAHVARHFLGLAKLTVWMPLLREHKIVRGQSKTVLTPLFPAYMFVQVELQWHEIRRTPGVIRLVMDGDQPARVPDRVIEELMEKEVSGAIELPPAPPRLRAGGKVKIINGLFRDRVGLVAGMAPRDRVIVLLSLLGGQQRVELAAADVEAIEKG